MQIFELLNKTMQQNEPSVFIKNWPH